MVLYGLDGMTHRSQAYGLLAVGLREHWDLEQLPSIARGKMCIRDRAASIRARRSVSPVLGSSASAKEIPGLQAAGCGWFVSEIRSIPCG